MRVNIPVDLWTRYQTNFIGNTNHNIDKRKSAKQEADGSNLDQINTQGLK